MEDSYHTIGAQRDRARTWDLMEKRNEKLDEIAKGLVGLVTDMAHRDESRKTYHFGPNHLEAVLTYEGLILDIYETETGMHMATLAWTAEEMLESLLAMAIEKAVNNEAGDSRKEDRSERIDKSPEGD